MNGIIITSTEPEAGKTYIISLLLKALRNQKIDAVAYLPITCGIRSTARQLHEAGPRELRLEEINPVYLKNLTSPYVATLLEGTSLDIDLLAEKYHALAKRFELVLVEGIGGWETPLTKTLRFSDFAASLGLPVAIVAANTPGMLNHAILTTNAVKSRGLNCAGLIINNIQEEWSTTALTNRGVAGELTGLPVLAELISGQDYIDESPILEALRLPS